MRYLWFLLVMMLANVAQAMNCQELPDCASLGYSKAEDPNCVEDGYLNCPFDQDYKVCVQYNCEALGFTEDDKTSWCADLIECKGNPQMTLCQKPCFATNYEELSTLAESGKCKIITMKNDIKMPENSTLTLAENTFLDGGNYTLDTSLSANNLLIDLSNNAGIGNLTVQRSGSCPISETLTSLDPYTKGGVFLIGSHLRQNKILVRNISVNIDCPSSTAEVFSNGQISLMDNINLSFKTHNQISLFPNFASTYNIKNADIKVNADNLSAIFSGNHYNFENSKISISAKFDEVYMSPVITGGRNFQPNTVFDATNAVFTQLHNLTDVLMQSSSTRITTITLKNGAHVEYHLHQGKMVYDDHWNNGEHSRGLVYALSGSEQAPVTLMFEGVQEKDMEDVSITSTNITDTLILNGVTYHPQKAATTLLSEVDSSGNWTRVP